jgi:hypothetical protein
MMLKRLAPVTMIGMFVAAGCTSTPAADPATDMDVTAAATTVGYDGIPRNAMRVSSGRAVLRFRVGRDGTVWIGDDDLKVQLTKATVSRRDVVEVDPYSNQVTINDQVVYRGLNKNHRHSIFHLDGREQPKWH